MAASAVESEGNSSVDYVLMEDALRAAGKRESSVRAVLTPQSETRDNVAPLPCASPTASSHARSETPPQGILRHGSAGSGPGSPAKNCRKKQVSIKLPERGRRRYELSGTDGDSSSDDDTHQKETIVEVEVKKEDEEKGEEEEEDTAGELCTHTALALEARPN